MNDSDDVDPDDAPSASNVSPSPPKEEPDPLEKGAQQAKVTESQKRSIMKVHTNTGHPPRDQMLRMMKAAGALPRVLEYIRDEFHCDQCALRRGPANRRRTHCPRTFAFNKLVSVDVLYLQFDGQSVPILNMVCIGTSYQIAQRIPIPDGMNGGTPTAHAAWRQFLQTWTRYLGAPTMITCDSGSEFKGVFERGCEQMGILQHVIAPESPWQNAKAERHGGWLKEKLDREVSSGRCSFGSLPELDEFLAALTSAKNRWFNRGGYTPSTLVFGELPRIPDDLLSDDYPGLHGLHDAYSDPLGIDESAREYRKRHHIREKARQAALEQASHEAISKALRSATHQSKVWNPGQWVYVFRRGRPSQELHPRDRWVGPGVVLLANNRIVYVAMRARLWRCSPEQLRAAMPSEILGRDIATDPSMSELLRQVLSGSQAGAVDVAREGPPPLDESTMPVAHQDVQVPSSDPLVQPRQAPQEVEVIPPRWFLSRSLLLKVLLHCPPMATSDEEFPRMSQRQSLQLSRKRIKT